MAEEQQAAPPSPPPPHFRYIPVVTDYALAGGDAFTSGGLLWASMVLRGAEDFPGLIIAFSLVILALVIAQAVLFYVRVQGRLSQGVTQPYVDVCSGCCLVCGILVCGIQFSFRDAYVEFNSVKLTCAAVACFGAVVAPMAVL